MTLQQLLYIYWNFNRIFFEKKIPTKIVKNMPLNWLKKINKYTKINRLKKDKIK